MAEAACLENAADCSTIEVTGEIAAAVRKRPDLTPILIDFADPSGWRWHSELRDGMIYAEAEFLPAEPAFLDRRQFDSIEHFRKWIKQLANHAGSNEEHREAILVALTSAPRTGRAAFLDRLGLLTHTEQIWTADNLREFLGM